MMSSPKRLIIVEDSYVTLLHLETFLSAQGYEVISKLVRAEDLVDAVQHHSPDLILLDIMLQGPMNGIDAAKHLRNKDIITPIVFLTALTDHQSTRSITQIANCNRVPKPFEEALLLTTIGLAFA